MATNLKTGKKIRALIYRIIATGAFFVFIMSALMGREALFNLYQEGIGTLTGEIYYLTEFREYISYLYQQGMLAYAGIGDDNGNAIKTLSAGTIEAQMREDFHQELTDAKGDILYYVLYGTDSTDIDTNISYPIFSDYDGHLLLPENVSLCCYWDGEKNSLSFFSGAVKKPQFYLTQNNYGNTQYKPVSDRAAQIQLILAIEKDDDFSSQYMRKMAYRAEGYRTQLFTILGSGCLSLLFGIFSLFSRKYGKTAKADFTTFTRKILLEIKLLLIWGIILLWHGNELGYVLATLEYRVRLTSALWLYFPIGALLYLLWTDLCYNGIFVFTCSTPIKLCHYIKKYSQSKPWQRKSMTMFTVTMACSVIAIFSGIMCFLVGGICEIEILVLTSFLLTGSGLVLLPISLRLLRFVNDSRALVNKISELQQGKTSPPLLLSEASLLKKAASDLNDLESGIEHAVEQQNRSNRMRVELLTNVSHDLKTPLTSIINYADLLCDESLPEPACDYARALKDKAYRLKNMVQDVFDLSKATTGNLPVEKQRLDLVKLIRQTLADMDEKISDSTLSFKLNISEEPLMIEADGDKLYRIFQNLFVNALQYSLDYSRVHIQLSSQDGYAVAKIKNTSKGELDFDTAEIIERFVRSDASRTTEGSGLGLSIVQSFTETCGGTFTIETDADMFTACVSFPLSQETIICEPEKIESTELLEITK
ncbi:MAG: HAMP domain-containing histidine kinase [Lachnospiraceae bacterium]|nr:HAMP domain-containing histidine kinase [Lachnospiraceae bacterium]